MISRFFIDRPIFASVLSLVITLAGAVTVFTLPIAQYPNITPPTVQVTCSYPGANAQVVADTVAAPIEQQVNGVENMLYMSSQCTNDGAYNLTVTFDLATDLKIALVQVQNRVSLAMPQLPNQVQQQGVNVKKKSPNILLAVNLVSPDGRYDDLYLSNYATIHIKDELARLPGVGDINFLGERDYSIRAWLDPEKLATRNLTASEVVNALREQNIQVAAGQVGQPPMQESGVRSQKSGVRGQGAGVRSQGAGIKGPDFQATLTTLGRLTDPDDFGDIVVKTGPRGKDSVDAAIVRLRDVARVELGAQQYDQSCTLDGKPSVALAIFQLPGSNALDTAEGIRKKMDHLAERFPEGLEYRIVYDTTPFISESIVEVIKTLRDAVVLVAIVVLVFLQNWRATLIPLIAVPVALFGTFAVMAALGFSLNNLSLFGLVLAIGIVVDDAIVVVENVERWLMAEDISAREAAIRAMDEVTGPVVAVALVLCAVFIPCAFISGITGQFFRQFALTIAVSTVISAFNSLTLSPALAALLLQPHSPLPSGGGGSGWGGSEGTGPTPTPTLPHRGGGRKKGDPLTRLLNFTFGWFFKLFNASFDFSTSVYTRTVGLLLRGCVVVLILYAGLLYLTGWSFTKVPTGFIPQQDKGYLLVNVQLPDAASVQRTQKVMARINQIAQEIPGIAHTLSVAGESILMNANSPNFGSMFVIFDEFDKRRAPDRHIRPIATALRKRCYEEIPEAMITVFGPPPVDGLGTAGGFKLMVQDRIGIGLDGLQHVTDDMVAEANAEPGLVGVFTVFRSQTPQLYVDIDRTKVKMLGVRLSDVFDTLQMYMGSLYVNNFNEFGRSWQVNVQADAPFRNTVEAVQQLKVRNRGGLMVPMDTLAEVRDIVGPVMVMRYNMYPAAPINGSTLPGTSSGEAIARMEALAKKTLPPNVTIEWTELTYMEILASRTDSIKSLLQNPLTVFVLAVVLVFLVLAAQYESWTLPLAVILVVPMCLLCSVAGVAAAHLDINIFTQIGFVVLVGLASKNAILIVEFAKQETDKGVERRQATLEACRLRLRPIMMTSFAFILGVVPLIVAEGAGSEMRKTLGLAVFSGMLGVTLFGIFLTPVFFYVIEGAAGKKHAGG